MARRTTLRAATLLPALALVVAAAGCGGGGGGEAKGVPLVNEGQLTTCTNAPYEPFESREDGEIVGFDIDLIDLVAEDLGVEQQVTNSPFTTIQSGQALNVGNCDVAAAAITINDVREENFDFSDPYFDATQALLAPRDSGIDSLAKLEGKTLGYQKGTTGAEYAKEHAEQHGATLKQFADLGLLLQGMRTGKVDAVINDDFALLDFEKENRNFEVTKELRTDESYGFGVKTGNDKLKNKINEVLAEAKRDGTYDRLYEKWFGTAPADS
ncbi:ABC transporter substrate-binding protein [Actinopolyspora erythraea]|uniref:ABC transporter substrate-binding protein n=1 Tax=Actinopolyspora erythraea TaxID=414996 RepID=A0A099DA66_9ACTN|nr:transporter substrate-binding domain-containing protein [Actinopolyspora erythraea]ASU80528.1 ABC transporter substrate-binding protein [Actinopolyspora erythraea]KGI82801.1 ABC transporter substrate-binding protein [Actinopolyspora erythraea]